MLDVVNETLPSWHAMLKYTVMDQSHICYNWKRPLCIFVHSNKIWYVGMWMKAPWEVLPAWEYLLILYVVQGILSIKFKCWVRLKFSSIVMQWIVFLTFAFLVMFICIISYILTFFFPFRCLYLDSLLTSNIIQHTIVFFIHILTEIFNSNFPI